MIVEAGGGWGIGSVRVKNTLSQLGSGASLYDMLGLLVLLAIQLHLVFV